MQRTFATRSDLIGVEGGFAYKFTDKFVQMWFSQTCVMCNTCVVISLKCSNTPNIDPDISFKWKIQTEKSGSEALIKVVRKSSGMSGGLIGMNQVKKELNNLFNSILEL